MFKTVSKVDLWLHYFNCRVKSIFALFCSGIRQVPLMHRGLVLCQIDDDGIHFTLTLVIKSHASQLQLKMPNIIWSLCKTHTTHSRSLPNVTTRIIFAILNNLRLQPHQLSCSADAPPGFSDELPLVSLWSP